MQQSKHTSLPPKKN